MTLPYFGCLGLFERVNNRCRLGSVQDLRLKSKIKMTNQNSKRLFAFYNEILRLRSGQVLIFDIKFHQVMVAGLMFNGSPVGFGVIV